MHKDWYFCIGRIMDMHKRSCIMGAQRGHLLLPAEDKLGEDRRHDHHEACAVDKNVILLHPPPLPSGGGSIATERERQQSDSLFNG